MALITTWTARTTVGGDAPRYALLHRVMRALADALNGLAPPRRFGEAAELPAEWFKYPPY